MTDTTLQAAMFLSQHRGWSPDDLERADPDLIDQMNRIRSAEDRVQMNGG